MKNISDTQTIQMDFDRIALLSEEAWSHNDHYHPFLLQQIPAHCENALEIGCGTGEFARNLSQHANHVLALDLAQQMIQIARERSTHCNNIDFKCADIMNEEFPDESFDFIASIATLHHVSLEEVLLKIQKMLKGNGTLAILDLYQAEGPADGLRNLVATPTNIMLNLIKNGHVRPSREKRLAWEEHSKHDVYLPVSRVREICLDILPGASVRKHLFWRYSIVWHKPETDASNK